MSYTMPTPSISDPVLAELALMIPDGEVLRLPETQLSNYAKIKTLLTKAGGKYKRSAFYFSKDAAEVQKQLCSGEVLNDQKKYQYFPTPKKLAEYAIKKADLQPDDTWLEPQAGQGHIAEYMMEISTHGTLVELMPYNVKVLKIKAMTPSKPTFSNGKALVNSKKSLRTLHLPKIRIFATLRKCMTNLTMEEHW